MLVYFLYFYTRLKSEKKRRSVLFTSISLVCGTEEGRNTICGMDKQFEQRAFTEQK